jgi:hypothetical protein
VRSSKRRALLDANSSVPNKLGSGRFEISGLLFRESMIALAVVRYLARHSE